MSTAQRCGLIILIILFLKDYFLSFRILKGFIEDDEGVGQGDHFLPRKFIKRSFEH